MMKAVLYKPGSKFVNMHGNSQMGALVFTFMGDDCPYQAHLWLGKEDLHQVRNRKWVREKAIGAFGEIVDHLMQDDISCVEPMQEPWEDNEEEQLDSES